MDEKILLQLAVEHQWVTPARLDEIHCQCRDSLDHSRPADGWQVIPLLLREGELTLEQLETLSRKAATLSVKIDGGMDAGQSSADEDRHQMSPGDIDRYRIEEFIGAGGMGEVYKAYDHTLQRFVALKILKTTEMALHPRFLQEARLQAKVDHDNVCKVFDVGFRQGRWYIAMTYIPGSTLKQIAGELRVEEKVKLIQEVAEALHAAHRLGLVHRDVKPANIMVEIMPDGRIKPYVTDFGLGRDLNRRDITMTHDLAGSLHYMAPEQLEGDHSEIDRRADVYGLGITLYELLSGRVPFRGDNLANVAAQILRDDPQPLRQAAPLVASDLESIVMKCLEKDPGRRYPSAKDLAEDLGHFLNAEPISAKRYSIVESWIKKIEKHRALTATSGIVLALILVLAGLWLRSQWQSQAAVASAGQFGRDVEEMESIMRYAYLLPPHDIRADRRRVGEKMEEARKRMVELGRVADGPGNYALGQGYLALRDYSKAQQCLQTAWEKGFRTPEVAYALGSALVELYKIEANKALHISDKKSQQEMRAQLKTRFIKPAQQLLGIAKLAKGVPAGYSEAVIAYYDSQYSATLEKINSLKNVNPQFYETCLLAGVAYLRMGDIARRKGQTEESLGYYRCAEKALQAAAEIGRSDPVVYQCLSELYQRLGVIQQSGPLKNDQNFADKAAVYCDQALAIDPDLTEAYLAKAATCGIQTNFKGGRDVFPLLQEGLKAARRAVVLSPDNIRSHYWVGKLLQLQGDLVDDHREDYLEKMQESLGHFQQALAINPGGLETQIDAAYTLMIIARYRFNHGLEYQGYMDSSVKRCSAAAATFPDSDRAQNYLANLLYYDSVFKSSTGKESLEEINLALEHSRKAVLLNPEYSGNLIDYGELLLHKARCERENGRDPRPCLVEGLNMEARALRISPAIYSIYTHQGNLYIEMAQYNLQHGADPGRRLRQAESALKKSRELNPDNYLIYPPLLLIEFVHAQRASWLSQSPKTFVDAARRKFQQGLSVSPDHFDLYNSYAMVLNVEGKYQIERGMTPGTVLAEARKILEKAVSIKVDSCDSHRLLGELAILEARAMMTKDRDPTAAFTAAQKSISLAQRFNCRSAAAFLAQVELCRWQVEWRLLQKKKDTVSLIKEGLSAVDQALKIKPDCAEAFMLKADLLKAKADISADRGLQRQSLHLAETSLAKGLSINPLLKNRSVSSFPHTQ